MSKSSFGRSLHFTFTTEYAFSSHLSIVTIGFASTNSVRPTVQSALVSTSASINWCSRRSTGVDPIEKLVRAPLKARICTCWYNNYTLNKICSINQFTAYVTKKGLSGGDWKLIVQPQSSLITPSTGFIRSKRDQMSP
jgi:hypothetical protein